MSQIPLNSPPPSPAASDRNPAAGVEDWLCGLLDTALDRGDAPLVRLISGVVDDLRKAGGG